MKECYARNNKEGRRHAYTIVEGGEPSQEKSYEEEIDQKEYFL